MDVSNLIEYKDLSEGEVEKDIYFISVREVEPIL